MEAMEQLKDDLREGRISADRLIVAQALTEAIPLVSADTILDAYGVQRLW